MPAIVIRFHTGGSTLHALGEGWVFAPGILAPIVVSAALYARGTLVLWRSPRQPGAGVRHREAACFGIGWFALVVAPVSPLHALSERLFWVHMVQHELLMVVAAPLLVLGRPMIPMLWALPRTARVRVGSVARLAWWRSVWEQMTRPFNAWLLQAVALWAWHVPRIFEATLDSEAVHAAQHASFLVTALLFWWSIVQVCRRHRAQGAGLMYLFTTFVHTGALGALLTFSRMPWYPRYAASSVALGLTPLEDQQLAGLVMWLPASTSYLIGALALLVEWMWASESRVSLRERATGGAR